MTTKASRHAKPSGLKPSIFLVDDHSILRDGLRRLLESEGNYDVCGEASDAKSAVLALKKSRPDLVIVDLSLPSVDGIELIKILRSEMPKLRMLVLSMHDASLYAERALRAGAMGYVMKQSSPRHLLTAVQTVLRNQVYLNPSASLRMIHAIVDKKSTHRSEFDLLTDRELRILQLIGEGFTSAEIGGKLGISRKTVESHRGNVRRKLDLRTGAELTRFALSHRKS